MRRELFEEIVFWPFFQIFESLDTKHLFEIYPVQLGRSSACSNGIKFTRVYSLSQIAETFFFSYNQPLKQDAM